MRIYTFLFHPAAEVILNMFCYTQLRIKEVNKTMTNKKRKRKKDRYRSLPRQYIRGWSPIQFIALLAGSLLGYSGGTQKQIRELLRETYFLQLIRPRKAWLLLLF